MGLKECVLGKKYRYLMKNKLTNSTSHVSFCSLVSYIRNMNMQYTSAETKFNTSVRSALVFQDEDFFLPSETQYREVLQHIEEHTYYANTTIPKTLTFEEGVYSWYEEVYEPIMRAVDSLRLLQHMPGASRGELYLWVTRHWHFLKERSGQQLSSRVAVLDFGRRFSSSWRSRFRYYLRLQLNK